jgi:hypothetical protein
VQEYSNRYNVVLCHARDLNPRQKAELFVGGLPEHIQVDVEMHHPPDLHTSMYLARAFERLVTATTAPDHADCLCWRCGYHATVVVLPSQWGTAVFPPIDTGRTIGATAPGPLFKLRRALRAGHVCKRLFYLETVDYVDDPEHPTVDNDGTAPPEDSTTAAEEPTTNALVVSMYALAGIRTENTMLLLVQLKGERLLALLDTGSTHSFLQGHVMCHLGLSPTGAEHPHITVASGERLSCEGIAQDVPIFVNGVPYPVTCVGLALGCFDFILDVDFLRTLGPLTWDFDTHMVAFQRGA